MAWTEALKVPSGRFHNFQVKAEPALPGAAIFRKPAESELEGIMVSLLAWLPILKL